MNTDFTVNQSQLAANTCSRHVPVKRGKTRTSESQSVPCSIMIGRESGARFQQCKTRQTRTTFDTWLKTASTAIQWICLNWALQFRVVQSFSCIQFVSLQMRTSHTTINCFFFSGGITKVVLIFLPIVERPYPLLCFFTAKLEAFLPQISFFASEKFSIDSQKQTVY